MDKKELASELIKVAKSLISKRIRNMDDAVDAIINDGFSGNGIKAIVLNILRQADREDWIVKYSGKEVDQVVQKLLKKKGLKNKELIDWISMPILKSFLGEFPSRGWTVLSDNVDNEINKRS